MIVVDTSALIAILECEPDRTRIVEVLGKAEAVCLSAVIYYEAALIAGARRGPDGIADLDEMLAAVGAEIRPFDVVQAKAANAAYAIYGKGHHPTARLNLCDCVSYALAKSLGAPLLFKGDDFAATDIEVAK